MAPDPRALTEAERLDWLRLIRSENIGPVAFFRLLDHFGSAAGALDGAPELSRRGGRSRAIRIAAHETAEREIEQIAAIDARLVGWGEPGYPQALMAIHDPPPLIAVRGNVALLDRRAIAIVGARNASGAGRRFAGDIARDLGEAGLVVASGMARGIDTAAHNGALETGTVAVVAGGVDNIYPAENRPLYEALIERGAVVSEQPFGTEPGARHFPRRNRLISGLALGVLVVEAAQRSGSLITARMALEQGREVFAVPGSPLDPRCKGTNDLIRKGAILVECAADVVDGLEGMAGRRVSEPRNIKIEGKKGPNPDDSAVSAARSKVMEFLGPTPVTVDELVRECHVSPPVAMAILLEIELAGRLERHAGNRISLVE